MELNGTEGNISSSLVYKVVPWVNWDEWNYVRSSIFSSSPKLISAALQRISAWESRGCLPIAVELTAIIIEIHQKDPFFKVDGSLGDSSASKKMLNMLYGMSILRLVNYFVEPAHKKTRHSVSDLAEAIGIPRTLVDIRHESTHRCLPSLKLVRSASVKALEWLKANYWEPQSIAIHDPRKEIKFRLREMISSLRAHKVSRKSSAKNKRKYSKKTSLVKCHKLLHFSEMVLASKSDGSKLHVIKITRKVAHLYSLYPSKVVSVLLELFLSQASDLSEDISMEHSDDSDCSSSKPISSSLTDLKKVITEVSHKRPRLILSMLKAIFEIIEEKDTSGNDFSQSPVEINQLRHLRSLVLFLIRNLKSLKDSGRISLFEENQFRSTNKITTPKVTLTNLLQKCLSSFVPGDKDLLRSALLLAEMSENRFLLQKLKKLPLLSSLNHNDFCSGEIDYNESMLLEEEDSVKKASERLDLMKSRLVDRKSRIRRCSSGNSGETNSRWRTTKSWTSCPIGMLPCSFSSTAVLPVLDLTESQRELCESQTICQNVEKVENVCDSDMREMVSDVVEYSGNGGVSKRRKQSPENEVLSSPESAYLLEGRLLIGGLWKKVSEEELSSIESDIRIFA